MSHVTAWMNPRTFTLSKIRPSQRDKYCMTLPGYEIAQVKLAETVKVTGGCQGLGEWEWGVV